MTMATFDPLAPTHLRLMAQLGHRVGEQMMGKSQTHADALHAHLTGNGQLSTHSAVPSNPQKAIASRTKDETLIGVGRRNNPDEQAERDYARRKRAIDRHPLRGTGAKGSFAKLKERVRAMTSGTMSKGIEHGQSFSERYDTRLMPSEGYCVQQAISDLKTGAKVAQKGSMLKSRAPAFDKVAKNLGVANPLRKSLTAGYGTSMPDLSGGSALREQSISAKKKPKPLSPEDLLKAASTLMHHGRLDPQTAQKIQTCVHLTNTLTPDLMKALQEACRG